MDSLLTSVNASSKPQGLSGLLSSLDSMLGSSMNPGAFARFLQHDQNAAPAETGPSNPSQQNAASQTPVVTPPSGGGHGGSLGVLKKIVSDLHRILTRLNPIEKNKSAQARNQAKGADVQSGDTPQTQNNPVTAVSNPAPDTSDDDSTDVSSSDDSTASLTQTPAQILADLILLMQTIEKKLEAVDSAGVAQTDPSSDVIDPAQAKTADANNTNSLLNGLLPQTTPTADSQTVTTAGDDADTGKTNNAPASAADPLTQLLALIQSIEQKLAPAATGAPPTSNPAAPDITVTAATVPDISPPEDFFRLSKDLKALMALLKDAAGNNNAPADSSAADPAGETVTTANLNNSSVTAGLLLKNVDPAQTGQSAPAAAPDFLGLFAAKTGTTFSDPSTANIFAAGNPALAPDGSADGKNSGGLDWNNDGGSGNLQTAAGLKADAALMPDALAPTSPYNFASQLSDLRAVNGGTTGLPNAVEQVLLQLNRGVKDGNDQMTIQLQPADLGKISIKLDISADNKVQGTVVADNPATLNLLLKDVRSLERALQEAGLRADSGSLQFSLGGQSQSGDTSGQMPGGSDSGVGASTSFNAADASPDVSPGADETWVLTPGRVNFKV